MVTISLSRKINVKIFIVEIFRKTIWGEYYYGPEHLRLIGFKPCHRIQNNELLGPAIGEMNINYVYMYNIQMIIGCLLLSKLFLLNYYRLQSWKTPLLTFVHHRPAQCKKHDFFLILPASVNENSSNLYTSIYGIEGTTATTVRKAFRRCIHSPLLSNMCKLGVVC